MGQPIQEPSMEDILASIKRIIAEDGEAAVQRGARMRRGPVAVPDLPAAPRDEDDGSADAAVADKVFGDTGVVAAAAAPAPAPAVVAVAPEMIVDDDLDVLELTSPLPDPYHEDYRMAAASPLSSPAPTGDPILSGAAANASRNAFAALSQLQVRAETGQENTLEGLVTDLLRPMLRDWLDRELPGIVERLVAAEIQRVSGRG